MKRWKLILLSALALATTATALAIMPYRAKLMAVFVGTAQVGTAKAPVAEQTALVRRTLLRPLLREALNALGDRLEKPGKERLTLTAMLSRGHSRKASPVLIIRQFADKLRLEEQAGGRMNIITFDGSAARKDGGEINTADEDLIETLACDTAESFFAAGARGRSARFMGSRFRLDDDDGIADGQPVYDLYELTDEVAVGQEHQRRTKLYYFNSDSLLLERVRYEIERGGVPVRVEILLGDWQKSEGQSVPHRVERFENGTPIFALTLGSPSFRPRADDQSFTTSAAAPRQ